MNYAWSFSVLDSFETCPKKHYHYKIAKDVEEPAGPPAWGLQVHQALANRINKQRPLPQPMQKFDPWVDYAFRNVDRTKTLFQAERKMALTARFEPCDYFDKVKQVWVRTVIDVLKINGEAARVIDWKTGKYKDDTGQLGLAATAVFAHYPEVKYVACNYAWLAEDQDPTNPEEVKPLVMTRQDLKPFWLRLMPRVNALGYALLNNEFPPKPSGLCKKHCNVVSCPYHGKGSY